MSCHIECHAAALSPNCETTRSVFNLSSESRDIFEALVLQTPQLLESLEYLQLKIPLPKNASSNIDGRFYRLPNHNRSFCYSLAQSRSMIDAPVLVFKGSEPLLQDFPIMIEWMLQTPLRRSSRVMADHFPLSEGKIPGALSLSEATREAQIALEVQKKHLQHYGELARLPVPLLIHSIAEEKRDKCAGLLRRKLSRSAFDRIEPLIQHGLAIYVYYYPSAPIRANYWGDLAAPQIRQFIQETLNEDEVVTEWVKLVVRLLYLGYLPYTVRNEGLGACMDFGNATLDGGFCDPDSIVPIEADMDDEFFRESAIQSLAHLQNTVRMLLGLTDSSVLYPSIEEFACRRYIDQLINDAIASESRPGLHLDERFLKLLFPRTATLVRSCASRRNRVPSYMHFSKRAEGRGM